MVAPSMNRTEFTCPRCGELAQQTWLSCYANRVTNAAGLPLRIQGADLDLLANNPQFPPDIREQKVDYWNRVNAGEVFLDRWAPVHTDVFVAGMELSVCHACTGVAVWLGGEMVHPAALDAGDS